MLKGKTVLLGVTGSIAAYKIASRAGTCTDDAECYEFYQSDYF